MYRVLLVDDREIFIMELKRLRVWGEISGFEAAGQACNGKQALEMLETGSYDMVMTDIRMPMIDGLQLLGRIKQERLCPCVVLLSEYSEFHYAREGIILGAFDYLVKPTEEKAMLDLFHRARGFLDSQKQEDEKTAEVETGWAYPAGEEKKIISEIQNGDPAAVRLFQSTSEELYAAMAGNIIRADLMLRRLYRNIVEASYARFPWLRYYMDSAFFNVTDGRQDGNTGGYINFYCRKLDDLLEWIRKYLPGVEDGTIREVCNYVLEHPEADLKLKVLAEKFYINNTYLSNTFAAKTGMHFNNYTTMVKMARAEYLFRNTTLKTYEVSYQLGYHDINYFSRLFRSHSGQSPAEFRNRGSGEASEGSCNERKSCLLFSPPIWSEAGQDGRSKKKIAGGC